MAATAALRRSPVTGEHRHAAVAAMGSSYIAHVHPRRPAGPAANSATRGLAARPAPHVSFRPFVGR